MTTKIFEELPTRKHPQSGGGGGESSAPASGGGGSAPAAKSEGGDKKATGGTEENEAKRIRQAVYDIRYRARREDIDLKQAFSQYMQNSGLSQAERTAVRAKLFGKEGGGGVSEKYSDAGQLVSDHVASALQSVFTETEESYIEELKGTTDTKYKVRVTDKATERTYVRYADRAKITQLRSNPNISSVEMTDHGDPYEGEQRKGTQTAKALGGGPKKAKKDFDGDGKIETPKAEYKGSKDKAIKKAMAKEDFIADAKDEVAVDDEKKIDVMKGKNTKLVKVSPKIGVGEAYDKKVKEKNEKDPNADALDTVGCKDPDWRSMKTQRTLRLNKLRAIGLKMGRELEGNALNEGEKTPAQIAATTKYEKIKKLTNQGKHKEASALYNAKEEVEIDENRMAAYTAGMSDAQKDAATSKVSKTVADKMGRRSDEAAFRDRKRGGGERKKYDKKMSDKFGDKSRQNKTGRGQPQQYRASADRDEWSGRFPYGKSEIVQGKSSIKDLKNEYSWLTEEFLNESMDLAVDYFYKQGINEDGLNLIIEEVGIEDFTDFVLDLRQDLNEERDAERDPNPTPYATVKAKIDKAETRRQTKKQREYAPGASGGDPAPRKKKTAAKEAPEKKAEAKPTPKKKVEVATVKAKKKQPAKPISKKGLLGRVRDTVERGVTRHKEAVKKVKGEVKKVKKTLDDTAAQHKKHGEKFKKAINPKKEINLVKGVAKAVTEEDEK